MATYEQIRDIRNTPEKYLIDVRNKDELEETGVIPGSINIPLPQLENVFQLSADEFETTFHRSKPSEDAKIILSCKSGGRAQRAVALLQSKGFANAIPYIGSWTEWAQKEGLNK